MTQPSEITAIFRDWYMAELASHYAAPCPDDVMDHLVDQTWCQIVRLIQKPATNAEDILLKVFPLLLATYEPKEGDAPMGPVFGEYSNGSAELLQSVVDDLKRVCPLIAEAMRAPNLLQERAAA